jgi:Ca2+-binding RTX toxin-like protein
MPTMNVLTDAGFDAVALLALAADANIIDLEDVNVKADRAAFAFKKIKFELSGEFDPDEFSGRIDSITVIQAGEPVLELADLRLDLSLLSLLIISGPTPLLFALLNQKFEVNGGEGPDVLLAGSGDYFGNGGNDVLMSLGKADFDGGFGARDAVSYSFAEKGVTASLADASANKGEAQGDTYESIEGLIGSNRDDTLIGDVKSNRLSGGDGDDTLEGGRGKDTLDGGGGTDFASYQNAPSVGGDFETGVRASLARDRGYSGDAKADRYVNIEGLIGSSFDDDLTGGGGGDQIIGASGDDTVSGGAGDRLWGDTKEFGIGGDDTFLLRNLGDASVSIMDFDVFDRVAIDRESFGLDADFAFEDGVTFVSADNPVATGDGPTFLFDRGVQGADFKYRGELYFDADGQGGAAAVLVARVALDSQQYLDINDMTLI